MIPSVLTSFLFALTGLCATQSARIYGSGRANFLRLVVALTILAFWAHLLGSGWAGRSFGWFLWAGSIGFGIGGWCMFQALRRLGSTLSLLIVETLAAVFAGVFSWYFLRAELTPIQLGFASLTLMGVVTGLLPNIKTGIPRRALLVGSVMALLASVAQGLSFTFSKHAFLLLEESGESIDAMTASYQRLLGGTLIALILYGAGLLLKEIHAGKPVDLPENLKDGSRRFAIPGPAWVLLNALFGPVLGIACLLWAIRLVGNPGVVQTIVATATLLTVPLARHLEGTRMGWNYYLGCLMALLGISGLLHVWS